MIAFKGVTKEGKNSLGGEKLLFEVGKTMVVPRSKTVSEGFHCCENPVRCLDYYSLNGSNRFFMVEAEGDIDEDAEERIACTKLTPIKELTKRQFVVAAAHYIVTHPDRLEWQWKRGGVVIQEDEVNTERNQGGVARGKDPRGRGKNGDVIVLLKEPEPGHFTEFGILEPGENGFKDHCWYCLRDGKVVEA